MNEPTTVKVSPEEIWQLMKRTERVMRSTSPQREEDHWRCLMDIAKALAAGEPVDPQPRPILLSGWYLEEDLHGGYPDESGAREILPGGKGILLYRERVKPDLAREVGRPPNFLEVWKQDRKFVFLGLDYSEHHGYKGLDNHPGTDYWWRVVGIRILPPENVVKYEDQAGMTAGKPTSAS